MSKYNLTDLFESNMMENMSDDEKRRFSQLSDDDQLKLEKIFSMMKAEKNKSNDPTSAVVDRAGNTKASAPGEIAEDFDSVVDDIMDQGKSREDAEKIAGAINAKHVGNYREGVEENGHVDDYTEEIAEENDEDKLPLDEEEGFVEVGKDEIKMHLDQYRSGNIDGDDLAQAMEEIVFGRTSSPSERGFNTKYGMEEGAMQPGEGDLESGETGNMNALTEVSMRDIVTALKNDAKATDSEIKQYMASVKKSGDKFDDADDYVEDFKNYVADKSLQEHFGRFMKDYQ
jgi:hypothetical protein